MTRDDWRRIEPLLTQALALPEGERKTVVDTVALDDAIRRQILDLLRQSSAISTQPALAGAGLPSMDATPVEGLPVLHPGEALADGRFVVVRQIGRGGMGVVYLAQDTTLGTLVALKILPAEQTLIQEAQRAAACSAHEHVATVHNVIRTDHGGHTVGILVMDYIAGRPASRILEDGPVPLPTALQWIREAAAAVGYAHDCEVLHCDLKPANLLITPDGHVRVVDFGISRASFDVHQHDAPVRGTLPYMAPEQLIAGEFSRAGDVYSLGVTLFELITGRLPFDADGPLLRVQIVAVPPPPLTDYVSAVPDGLQDVLDRALAKDPDERFRSVRAFARALASLNAAETATMQVPAASRPASLQPARWWTTAAATVAAITAVVALMGFIASRAFEVVLRMDTNFTATPSDYFRVGREAMLPIAIYWIPAAAALAILAGCRFLLKLWFKNQWVRWSLAWRQIDPNVIAVTTVIAGAIAWLLLTWRHYGMFVALVDLQQSPSTAAVENISFASRGAHLEYAIASAYLSFVLVLAGLRWLPRLPTRGRDATTVRFASWAALVLALMVMAGPTVPRRFLFERFRVLEYDARQVLEIGRSADEVLVYDPGRRVSVRVPRDAANLRTTETTRQIFQD